MHKQNQILVLKDGSKLVVEYMFELIHAEDVDVESTGPACYGCCFAIYEYTYGFHYKCDKEELTKHLGSCKAPNGCCYRWLTKFRRGV